MNCSGLPSKRRDEKALQTKKTKRRENSAADFIFS